MPYKIGISQQDVVDDVLHYFDVLSIFFEKTLELETSLTTCAITIGKGFGGFHPSMFQKGFDCTRCGACCMMMPHRTLIWLPGETAPEGVEELKIKVNEFPISLRVHVVNPYQCDFLDEMKKDSSEKYHRSCTLLPSRRSIQCSIFPGLEIYRVGKNVKVPVLYRRLPRTNARWPHCPVDVEHCERDEASVKADLEILKTFTKAFVGVPGSYVGEAFKLYLRLIWDKAKVEQPVLFSQWKEHWDKQRGASSVVERRVSTSDVSGSSPEPRS